MLASALVLLAGMVITGTWLSKQIEDSAVNRAASTSSIYVESILASILTDWTKAEAENRETHSRLDQIFNKGPLHNKVIRFKLWDADGNILYSSDPSQLSKRFTIDGDLASAFTGSVRAKISSLHDTDNQPERELAPRLIEVYVPIYGRSKTKVDTVAEFYYSMKNLDLEIKDAKQRSWILVIVTNIGVFILLFGLVRRADQTIRQQEDDRKQQFIQLRTAFVENNRMRERLRMAGANTTALNEELLLRVAADLHDGPAQSIAFALLRFDEAIQANHNNSSTAETKNSERCLDEIRNALRSSLQEVRSISSGLTIPGITEMSLAEAARRAVRDFERRSGHAAQATIDQTLTVAPIAVKITTYRLLQESLANNWRHARESAPIVSVRQTDNDVVIEIIDHGSGFDPKTATKLGRLGLTFMRERVRLLGGIFEIHSSPGHGTRIHARLPLSYEETLDA